MRPPWLIIAEKEIGIHETPGPASTKRIQEYMDKVGYHKQPDEVPWCAGFIEWCLEQAGFEGTKSAAAVSYADWGEELVSGIPGAVVVFEWLNGSHHVGFFESQDQWFVKVVNGNSSDQVKYSKFPLERVLTYRWLEGYPVEEALNG